MLLGWGRNTLTRKLKELGFNVRQAFERELERIVGQQLEDPIPVDSIPVEGATVFARLNSGNVTQFGGRWVGRFDGTTTAIVPAATSHADRQPTSSIANDSATGTIAMIDDDNVIAIPRANPLRRSNHNEIETVETGSEGKPDASRRRGAALHV